MSDEDSIIWFYRKNQKKMTERTNMVLQTLHMWKNNKSLNIVKHFWKIKNSFVFYICNDRMNLIPEIQLFISYLICSPTSNWITDPNNSNVFQKNVPKPPLLQLYLSDFHKKFKIKNTSFNKMTQNHNFLKL